MSIEEAVGHFAAWLEERDAKYQKKLPLHLT